MKAGTVIQVRPWAVDLCERSVRWPPCLTHGEMHLSIVWMLKNIARSDRVKYAVNNVEVEGREQE